MNIDEVKQVFLNKEFGTVKELKEYLINLDSQYNEWRLVNEITGGSLYFMVDEKDIKGKIIEFN